MLGPVDNSPFSASRLLVADVSSGYDRFGTFNLFIDSGDLNADLERLLYTYARNLLGRHRPSIEFLYYLLDLVPEAVRRSIADILADLTTNIHPDSFRDAASLAQLVTTFAAERPETDEKVLQALQEHVEGYHQSAKRDCHAEEPLTEAARGIQNLFRLTDAEREALLLLYAVSQFEAFETVWTSHRPMSG